MQAERGPIELIQRDRIACARLLDIDCGSGLYARVAVRLGAAEIVAIDIDPNSAAAAGQLLAGHSDAHTQVPSIFDAPDQLGEFDVVYSWAC